MPFKINPSFLNRSIYIIRDGSWNGFTNHLVSNHNTKQFFCLTIQHSDVIKLFFFALHLVLFLANDRIESFISRSILELLPDILTFKKIFFLFFFRKSRTYEGHSKSCKLCPERKATADQFCCSNTLLFPVKLEQLI